MAADERDLVTDEGLNEEATGGSTDGTAGAPPAEQPSPPLPVGDEVPGPGQQLEAGEG